VNVWAMELIDFCFCVSSFCVNVLLFFADFHKHQVCRLLQLLACALDSVFEVLDCADDVFALGSTSNIVATELAALSWAKTRRKVLHRLHSV